MFGLLWVKVDNNLCDIIKNDALISIFSCGHEWEVFLGAYDERDGMTFPMPVFDEHEFVPEVAVRVWRI